MMMMMIAIEIFSTRGEEGERYYALKKKIHNQYKALLQRCSVRSAVDEHEKARISP